MNFETTWEPIEEAMEDVNKCIDMGELLRDESGNYSASVYFGG